MNPSQQTGPDGGGMFGGNDAGAVINTDDVSLKVFMDHLVKLAVQS